MANDKRVYLPGGDMAPPTTQFSVSIDIGGRSQKVALTTTSAQSTAIAADYAVLSLDVAAFIRRGSNPTAVSDGTDLYLPAGMYRISFAHGSKLALILATGTGNAYITPEV